MLHPPSGVATLRSTSSKPRGFFWKRRARERGLQGPWSRRWRGCQSPKNGGVQFPVDISVEIFVDIAALEKVQRETLLATVTRRSLRGKRREPGRRARTSTPMKRRLLHGFGLALLIFSLLWLTLGIEADPSLLGGDKAPPRHPNDARPLTPAAHDLC